MKTLLIFVLLLLSFGTIQAQDDNTVDITFVHIFGDDPEGDNRAEVIQQVIEAFEAENPGVRVIAQSTSPDYLELFNNALLAADQGNAPHIVQVEEGLTQLAIDSGYFIPLSDVASEEELATLEDVLPAIRSYYRLGDTIWSFPWNSSNPLLYYNKTMFEAAGLDPENPPSTFGEILTDCEALMNAELEIASCANWPMVTWFAEQWVAMQGGLIVNNNNGRDARATEVFYTSPEMQVVANFLNEMAERGYYTYSGTPNDYNGEGITFLSQQTAMTINSTAGLTLFQRFSMVQGFELGVAPLPMPVDEATNGVTVGGASLWLSADHSEEEIEAAKDFILFLTNTENDILWHQGTGYIPNRISSITQLTEAGWFEENPDFSVAVDQLAASTGDVTTSGGIMGPSAEVRGYLIQAFQSIVDGDADPLAALEVAKERGDAELVEYNSFFE